MEFIFHGFLLTEVNEITGQQNEILAVKIM